MPQSITAHMVVKNEDQWIYFAIQSILPYVDQFLITDTGSTDKTVEIIRLFSSPKIVFKQVHAQTSRDITQLRFEQIKQTQTSWLWVVDGDEVYPHKTASEVVSAIQTDKYEGVTVRRYDLLGDVYHRQIESVGEYQMFGQRGHLVLRALNLDKLPGLHLSGDYPLEGYYDQHNVAILSHDPQLHYITTNYLYHAMYLRRSSLGGNLPMFNRAKFKVETGVSIEDQLPEVFKEVRPSQIPDPLSKRSLGYELLASFITPIKKLKRKLNL